MHIAAAAAMKVCASAAAALPERRCRRARQETTCGEQLNEERTDNSATLLPTLPTPGCRRVVVRGRAARRRRGTQDVRRLVDLFFEWQRERALYLFQLPEPQQRGRHRWSWSDLRRHGERQQRIQHR